MFRRPTRLFLFKFIGLWGVHNVNSKLDEKTKSAPEIDQILNSGLTINHGTVGSDEAQAKNLADTSSAIERSRREIVTLLLKKGIPGLTICVSKNQKVVWRTAFGYCDVENQLTCDYDAQMRIGSISKSMFVGAVVGPMIEAGKLKLDSSIHQYLSEKEFPRKQYNGKETDITIKQLLSHTSGIVHYGKGDEMNYSAFRPLGYQNPKVFQSNDQFNRTGFYQRETFRDVIEALKPFKDEPLAGEPGKFYYTTFGYVLLSAVMQKIHQMDDKRKDEKIQDFWIRVLKQNWAMDKTNLDEDEVIIPKRAKYYIRTQPHGDLINAPYTDNSIKWAGGGINSTTEDLVRFANTLIDCYKGRKSEPLKAETVKYLWERNGDTSYAAGFSRLSNTDRLDKEKLIVFHTGLAQGASSVLMIYPESEVVVAILVNLGFVNLAPLAISIANEFEKIPPAVVK